MSRVVFASIAALVVSLSARADAPALGESVEAHVLEIRAQNPDRRDDVFSKMGGSSVASKAFLHCFATPYVDLGDHGDLARTLEYFQAGPASSFDRQSEAAGVSWNLKYVLGGRPANFREELRATQARWALILFGANDAQNENERVYLERLIYLVEALEEMGVVPILGAALPRRNASKDRWIQRFNRITEAVAEHWSLPFIDYHGALSALPKKGLAADGMHPNVLAPGGLRAACQLTEKGLRYGNNLRNLLTLQMLDALRQAVIDTPPETAPETAPAAAPAAATDTETDTAPAIHAATVASTDLPWSMLVHKSSLPSLSSLPPRCGPPTDGTRFARVRVHLGEGARLRASAFDLDGNRPRVFWVRIDEDGTERCVRRRHETLELEVPPGMWDLIVEVSGRAPQDGRMLVLIARDPR